jgi:hypothetical protein|tara:strand:- start:18438 stop:18872 length:435 start_codon:yes stop_codon:yes gene_type:complete
MPRITSDDIVKLFEEAAVTDKRLPAPFKKQRLTMPWQETRQEKMYRYSYNNIEYIIRPSSQDISRWWIASILLGQIVEDLEVKKIIWLRAKKFPYSQIGRFVGKDRRKVKVIFEEEIAYIRLWLELYQGHKKINDMIDKIVLRK